MVESDKKIFAKDWLDAWSGNNPDKLLNFYHSNVSYLDPFLTEEITSRDSLSLYLKKLLQKNPNWSWSQKEFFNTDKGFILHWLAQIPVKDRIIVKSGMDIVELEGDRIIRNEVYFNLNDLNQESGGVLYEVNLEVSKSISKEYEKWLHQHIADLLKLRGFISAKWFKNKFATDSNKMSWTVHYNIRSEMDLEHYFENEATKMRAEAIEKFGDRFVANRRILTLFK